MTDRIPPLAALRAFAAVARHGSFRARRARRCTSAPARSATRSAAWRRRWAPRLLTRARNGSGHTRTAVTSEGEALLRAVEAAFAQLGAACEAVRERARGTRPMLAISANGSVASLWLAPRLAAFAALHPSVQWQVRAIEETSRTWCARASTSPSLRVRRGAMAEGDRLLFSETVFPVCSPSLLPVGDPQELLRHNLLQEDHGSSREKDWSTWLELLGMPARGKADDRAVRHLQCGDRRGDRGRRHRARTAAADRPRTRERAADAAVRRSVAAGVVGFRHSRPARTRRAMCTWISCAIPDVALTERSCEPREVRLPLFHERLERLGGLGRAEAFAEQRQLFLHASRDVWSRPARISRLVSRTACGGSAASRCAISCAVCISAASSTTG